LDRFGEGSTAGGKHQQYCFGVHDEFGHSFCYIHEFQHAILLAFNFVDEFQHAILLTFNLGLHNSEHN
jgi:hypothetical protein